MRTRKILAQLHAERSWTRGVFPEPKESRSTVLAPARLSGAQSRLSDGAAGAVAPRKPPTPLDLAGLAAAGRGGLAPRCPTSGARLAPAPRLKLSSPAVVRRNFGERSDVATPRSTRSEGDIRILARDGSCSADASDGGSSDWGGSSTGHGLRQESGRGLGASIDYLTEQRLLGAERRLPRARSGSGSIDGGDVGCVPRPETKMRRYNSGRPVATSTFEQSTLNRTAYAARVRAGAARVRQNTMSTGKW